MTTDTEDLLWRRFNEWLRARRPDYPSEWDAYQAGHADAKAETADVGDPDAREMFNAGWCAAARFCGREDVVYDGLVGPGGCPAFEYAYRAAIDAAKGPA